MSNLPPIHEGMPGSWRTTIDVFVIRQTSRALLVQIVADGRRQVWVPQSAVTLMGPTAGGALWRVLPDGTQVTEAPRRLSVPAWLYKKLAAGDDPVYLANHANGGTDDVEGKRP
jgi:hypothetical protein